jgi:uncharacterized protein with HEPN domain
MLFSTLTLVVSVVFLFEEFFSDVFITKDASINISNSRKIVDTRNRIIHGYDSVSDEIIWGIVINHIPILQTEVKGLLEE